MSSTDVLVCFVATTVVNHEVFATSTRFVKPYQCQAGMHLVICRSSGFTGAVFHLVVDRQMEG
jgi:hypothetical protein